MERMTKNILITGARGAGKSTLARWLLGELVLPYAGFQTVVIDRTWAGPVYAMEELLTGKSVPISRLTPEGIRGIGAAFDTFGVQVMRRGLSSSAPVLLLDEIGRFERNSRAFLDAVTDALDGEKMVVAVLKKEELPHICAIRERQDSLLMDLDIQSREQARKILNREICRRFK